MTVHGTDLPVGLTTGVVIRVSEETCTVAVGGTEMVAHYAPQFPTPHVEKVSPGHLVALAMAPDGTSVVVWRWYDVVVVSQTDAGAVRVWEPAHGEVLAEKRPTYQSQAIGARAYASSGLPGAEWWISDAVTPSPHLTEDLAAVVALYTDNDLWESALSGR